MILKLNNGKYFTKNEAMDLMAILIQLTQTQKRNKKFSINIYR